MMSDPQPKTKLTIEDLIASQERTERHLANISESLLALASSPKPTFNHSWRMTFLWVSCIAACFFVVVPADTKLAFIALQLFIISTRPIPIDGQSPLDEMRARTLKGGNDE